MFYDIFFALCKSKGVSPSKACIDMGLSRSIAAKWKSTNTKPSADVLPKIAEYFGVTTDYLLGNEKEKAPNQKDERQFTDDDIKFALWGSQDIDDADLDDVKRYAEFIRVRKKDKND